MGRGSRFLEKIGLKKKSHGSGKGGSTVAAAGTSVAGAAPSAGGTAVVGTSAGGTTPAYEDIAEKYADFKSRAKALNDSDTKHANERNFNDYTKEKIKLDSEYRQEKGKLVDTTLPPEQLKELAEKKDAMEEEKKEADAAWDITRKKVPKNIAARKKLEEYKGSSLVKLIVKAAQLNQDDWTKEHGTDDQKKKLEEDRGKAKAAAKKSERVDDAIGKAGEASKWAGHISSLLEILTSSVETMKDMGVETAKSAAALAKADKMSVLKENHGSWTGWIGSGMAGVSLVSAVISAVELVRGLMQAHKRKAVMDAQEKKLEGRMILGNICSLLSNLIGAASTFTALVPFLGSVLSIADSGLQIVAGGLNWLSNFDHKHKMANEKERIWKEIEKKKKKYTDQGKAEHAAYFTIDGGKRDWSKIDQKRKEMQEVVTRRMKIDKDTVSATDAKNKTVSRKAEMRISGEISALREKKKEGNLKGREKSNYKRNMHAMEALELLAQYRNAEKAEKKMKKSSYHDMEGIITNAVKVVASGTTLVGEITAASGFGATLIAAGTGINIAEKGYEVGREVGSKIYKGVRKASGAEKNKKNTREEMAAYLYDKMVSIGPKAGNKTWDGNEFFKLDDVPDYKIREEAGAMQELESILRQGLDARMSILMNAPTSSHLKKALAAAFSQEGGVSFAQDSI